MSDKSKLSLATMIVSVITAIGYTIYALGSKAPEIHDIKSWAIALLIYIGISIVATILVQIIFRIAISIGISVKNQEKSHKDVEKIVSISMKEDEMDKQIILRGIRANYSIGGLGCVVALILLALNVEIVYALHTIIILFFIGGIVEGVVSIYCYEKGL